MIGMNKYRFEIGLAGLIIILFSIGSLLSNNQASNSQPQTIDTKYAVIYQPNNYNKKLVVWFHWYGGSAHTCPVADYYNNKGYLVVAPKFQPEADWENYELSEVIDPIKLNYKYDYVIFEGYSKGASGAVNHGWYANEIIAVAGVFNEYDDQTIKMYAGLHDEHLDQSLEYAKLTNSVLTIIPSSHNPWEFYQKLESYR